MPHLDLLEAFCQENGLSWAQVQTKLKDPSTKAQTLKELKTLIQNQKISPKILQAYKNSFFESLKVGQKFNLQELIYTQKFTTPPKRYSSAGLVKKMEELGIGRPSTYASIISTLQDRGYTETKNNIMMPTTLGQKVSQILSENFQEVTGSEMTATMEENLDKIAQGNLEYEKMLGGFWQPFREEVESKTEKLKTQRDKYRSSSSELKCPTCSGQMDLKLGRYGEYYQCLNNNTHQFAKNFREYEASLAEAYQKFQTQTFGRKCEVCSKDLIVRVSKSSLRPYIACPEYKVGNKHTVSEVNYGPCPECEKNKRSGVLVQKTSKKFKQSFLACSLPKEECGFVQKKSS